MTGSLRHSRFRWSFFALAVLFAGVLLFAAGPRYLQTADAKGVVRPRDNSSGDEQKPAPKEEKPAPREEKPAPREERPAPSKPQNSDQNRSSGNSVFGNRQETSGNSSTDRRDEPRTSDQSQRHDSGTPSVSGQFEKRDERSDPEYRYRHHYNDSFFYPYDRDFWSAYPYYNQGPVIIIDSGWHNPHRGWGRDYTYRSPLPGSLEEALNDIEATWWERSPEFLMWHVDADRSVDVFYKGKYSHSLSPREIYKLTSEAVDRIRTTEFRFTSADRDGPEVRAVAIHEFDGPDGKHRTAKLIYYLQRVRDRWVITQIDFNKTSYGSPKCFIATAAFGTPMENEVLTLRQFRDRYLLTNPLGKELVDLYYTISPPIADSIRNNETARAVVRAILEPVAQTCKVLVGE